MEQAATRADRYGGRSPRDVPAYDVFEAARYLRIPERTVRNWVSGYYIPSTGRRTAPVIDVADRQRHLLSFVNLLELHVLDAIRNVHGVSMPRIRTAITYVRDELRVKRPLVDEEMETDGRDLFVHRLGQLIQASASGQTSMLEMLNVRLDRIERDPQGIAIKLFLFTRRRPQTAAEARQEPRIIAVDPQVAFGRPVIAGSRVPTSEVAERYKAGESISDLVRDYERPQEEIEEAIRCELSLEAA